MSIMTFLIIAAMLGVLASLVLGITSMARHGPVAHHTSSEWMSARVGFQAIALALLITAIWLS
jgi:hypothetical protein